MRFLLIFVRISKTHYSHSVLLVQVICLAPAFRWPSTSKYSSPTTIYVAPNVLLRAFGAIVYMLALTAAISVYRTPLDAPRPYRPGPRIIRAGIWTVHFGMNNEGRDSQRGMRDLIRYLNKITSSHLTQCCGRDLELDIVGLLETDLHVSCFLVNFIPCDQEIHQAPCLWQPRPVSVLLSKICVMECS